MVTYKEYKILRKVKHAAILKRILILKEEDNKSIFYIRQGQKKFV